MNRARRQAQSIIRSQSCLGHPSARGFLGRWSFVEEEPASREIIYKTQEEPTVSRANKWHVSTTVHAKSKSPVRSGEFFVQQLAATSPRSASPQPSLYTCVNWHALRSKRALIAATRCHLSSSRSHARSLALSLGSYLENVARAEQVDDARLISRFQHGFAPRTLERDEIYCCNEERGKTRGGRGGRD